MNVLFVYSLDLGLNAKGLLDLQDRIYFGISYISSLLQKHGHHINLVMTSRLFGRKNKAILKKCLDEFKPKLICFTAIATQYDFILSVARYIKRYYPDIYLLIGGVHVSLNPEDVSFDIFNALCIGEGEYPVLELVSQLEKGIIPSGILNLWIKHGSQIEKNPSREFLQNIDSLPFPDRKMWQKWMNDKYPRICSILLSRGCPFNCSYCCNHAIRKIATGCYVRYRSAENIISEINEILIDFPATKELYLETETIISDIDWCLRLCSRLVDLNTALKQPLSFGVNIRVTPNIDLNNVFSAFKKANFRFVKIGVESGSERVRREMLRRNYSNQDLIDTVTLARKYGLQVSFYNLIGIPGETMGDFKETININRICKPDRHGSCIFFPYPGTDLYRLCKDEGLLKKHLDSRLERNIAVLDLPGFPRKEIQKSFELFNWYIYKGLNPEDKLADLVYILKKIEILLNHIPFLEKLIEALKKFLRDIELSRFIAIYPRPVFNVMKVLYISYDGALDPLGASQVVPYLIGLSRKGVNFTLLTYEKKERLEDKIKIKRLKDLLREHRIKWKYLVYHKSPTVPATAYDIINGFRQICQIILTGKIRLIHVRSFVGAIPALLAVKLFRIKLFYDSRGFYPEERVDGNIWKKDGILFKLCKFYEEKCFSYADWIVCLTYKAKEIMLSKIYFQSKPDKIEVIPTCADTEKFKPRVKNPDLVAKLGLQDKFVFIYCGSIGTWYMLDEMLEFFKVAKAINLKSFFLILTGFGELVKQKIEQRGLNLNDFYITYVDYNEIHQWFSLADAGILFIIPAYSKKSSCPTKFAETLSCGIPVVINAGIGDTDLFVKKYKLGVVLERLNPEAFAEAAKQIFDIASGSSAQLSKMRCRKFAEEFLGVRMAVDKYFSIYAKIYPKK